MKLKILVIGIMLIMISSTFVTSANIMDDNYLESLDANDPAEIKEINVAILSEEFFVGSGKDLFVEILEDYKWEIDNKSYKFILTEIFDKDILKGELRAEHFDVLLVPGGGVGDGEAIVKGFSHMPKVKKWKNNIVDFIIEGGGYTSYCGGTSLIAELDKKPESFLERQFEKSSLGVSCVKIFYENLANPFFIQFSRQKPEEMGAAAYAFGFVADYQDLDDIDWNFYSGVCTDIPICKHHPIFDDVIEDTYRVRWVAGPALVVPEITDRSVSILAWYPDDGISGNKSTSINAWKYIGGIRGLIKGFIKGIKVTREYNEGLSNIPGNSMFEIGDWKPTNKKIDLNFSNKPCITAEVYPNENQARIVLTGLHPEYPVWWGGHIEEMPDTDYNTLTSGFYNWTGMIPRDKTPEDEISHTWWMIRRQVAWAAKVPDNDLPPVYGSSQVCDFEENLLDSNFSVYCNVEVGKGITQVDLYYRYSTNGTNYDNWRLFDSDKDISNGWSWDFNSPGGTGYYQFYSIRNVEYEGYVQTEKIPPGADTTVYVVDD